MGSLARKVRVWQVMIARNEGVVGSQAIDDGSSTSTKADAFSNLAPPAFPFRMGTSGQGGRGVPSRLPVYALDRFFFLCPPRDSQSRGTGALPPPPASVRLCVRACVRALLTLRAVLTLRRCLALQRPRWRAHVSCLRSHAFLGEAVVAARAVTLPVWRCLVCRRGKDEGRALATGTGPQMWGRCRTRPCSVYRISCCRIPSHNHF